MMFAEANQAPRRVVPPLRPGEQRRLEELKDVPTRRPRRNARHRRRPYHARARAAGRGARRPGKRGHRPQASAQTGPEARRQEARQEAGEPRPARRSDREPPHRHPLPLGRRLAAGRLRLLWARSVRVRQGRHPLPHHAAGQYGHGRRIPRGSLRPGDLVFFSGLGHVGIYAGGGKFIHAPRGGTIVRWSRLSSHGSYYGATRVVAA